MKEVLKNKDILNDHVGCFGNFSIDDPICKKLCALNLRCYIERDQSARIEILEDIILGDKSYKVKTQ
ncbi:MAG: hypothetical protein EHM85_10765 [Desulfobacteraceae bacterium]|nr:MAG: hypothetical protein EHM85_10765 [Desulfobacteraceae bacterium]